MGKEENREKNALLDKLRKQFDALDAAKAMEGAGEEEGSSAVPSLADFEMSQQELWSTVGRIFASSAWLGAETLATHNLWFAVGTGALGIAIGMGVKRNRATMSGDLSN